MRAHLVNLTQGRLSEGGYTTSREDVGAIVGEHLPRAVEQAHSAGRPLPVVFFAHGGLVSERTGLRIASRQIDWWIANGVYPIHFVWETGLYEVLEQTIAGAGRRAARDVWDWTTDPAIELLARPGGMLAWSGMKRSATRASDPDGGARYLATRLSAFCTARPDAVRLHAVGHSAGAIFLAHFAAAARECGLPAFRTMHLLAPAISVKMFADRLAPRLADGVDHLTVYAMTTQHEKADHCFHVYRKSLLYLVSRAFETGRRIPLLGLEESLRSDATLTRIFGLDGGASTRAEVVWAPTTSTTGRAASTATTHGGFDDDGPTMNSVVRRVLDVDDDAPIAGFPAGARASDDGSVAPAPVARKRALCVGVNAYPTAPLGACVSDARLWKTTLEALGFTVDLLTDHQATRDAILSRLDTLVRDARAGDVLAFQFSGHGTQVPDTSRDESDAKDEALCPVDFASGRLIVDDDLAPIMQTLGRLVNLTCFIDCCHSGTISRLAPGAAPVPHGGDERARYVEPTAELIAAHRAFRAGLGVQRASGRTPLREVLFAACQPSELAWESKGQGDFTRRAAPLLLTSAGQISNQAFQSQVVTAFGASPRQRPMLTCAASARRKTLLAPLVVVS